MLKSKAAKFLKNITLVLASVAKAKTLALKTKTNALRNRFMIFSLLREKKMLMTSISRKLHALVAHQEHNKQEKEDDIDQSKAIVLYNHSSMSLPNPTQMELLANSAEDDGERDNGYGYGYGYEDEDEDDEEKFPDLSHSLFDDEDIEFEDPGGSVIDLVKNSKKEGEEFRLEDEIDQVADLFIKRFHRQMRMQKQLSIKRYREMLERST